MSRSYVRPAWLAGLLAAAVQLAWVPALAQLNRTELSLEGRVTATDNSPAAPIGQEVGDTLYSLTPRLKATRRGASLRLDADIGATLIGSVDDTRPNRVLPDGRAIGQLTVVERLFFIESAFDVRQVEEDPFGERADLLGQNTRTAATARVSPYLDVAFSPRVSARARADGIWTRYKDTLLGDARTERFAGKVEAKPEPLGWLLDVVQEKTVYRDPQSEGLEISRATATATLSMGGDWIIGLAAGGERNLLDGVRESDTLVGARMYWIPGPRTEVAVLYDKRFFGDGWNVSARHRMPRLALQLRAVREPTTADTGIRGDGLASFLDAILTTRNPDPAARAGIVDDLIATRGLITAPFSAIAVVAPYPQLRSAADLSVVYYAPRTVITVGAFGEERVRLAREDSVPTIPPDKDSRQAGISVGWNRRLSPQTGLDLSAAYSRITGLAAREGDFSRQGYVRASLIVTLSPRLNATIGAEVRKVRTNVTPGNSFDENLAFAAMAYRF